MSETNETTTDSIPNRKNRAKRVSFSEIDPAVIEVRAKDEQPSEENPAGFLTFNTFLITETTSTTTPAPEEPNTLRKWASRPRYSPAANRKDYKALVQEREEEQRKREENRRSSNTEDTYNEDDEIVIKDVPTVKITEAPQKKEEVIEKTFQEEKPAQKPAETTKPKVEEEEEKQESSSSSPWLLVGSIGFAVLAVAFFSFSNRL